MNLDRVTSGVDVPNDFNVIIEIPMNAEPIKYEIDKATGRARRESAADHSRRGRSLPPDRHAQHAR
jgi:inorganic pyrophosphatase